MNSSASASLSNSELKRWAFPDVSSLEKAALRRSLLSQRRDQDPRAAQYKSRLIRKTVLELVELRSACTVALYAPVRGEVDTFPLLADLLVQGKNVVLPRCVDNHVHFCRVADPERDLSCVGAFGIREPDPSCCESVPAEAIDLFLAPGVGFDLFGSRIGFGGGFYDRLLSVKRKDAPVIALAYDFQTLHAIPAELHDYPMTSVVTEETVYSSCVSQIISRSEADTRALAHDLVARGAGQGTVLALHGNLGTGKSVFVQGLAEALHTAESTASPTFVYCREYHGDIVLYHADGYRLERISETDADFWSELASQPGLIAVEWAERLGSLLPKQAVHLFGRVLEGDNREWTLFTPLNSQLALHGSSSC